ncbi:C-terminal helicase domain-containing protein [Asticcacaulis machinosus]|uniref:Helicase-related protein n=1 Tax=Asticcacaulis machinosus TaxID=2984211 RepID=A0ABT5HG07_9CAUL|nr:helicase-related protein [Asticcacaulis machinosus]MDC7675185.1 helicase-related protein [Asticcacaulis machinosus]
MAQDVSSYVADTFRYDQELERKYEAQVSRIDGPPEGPDGTKVMYPRLGRKAEALFRILKRHPGQRGVLFFRNIRILERLEAELVAVGYPCVTVHGQKKPSQNDQTLDQFRQTDGLLLLITRDTGKRGLDLPEADFAVFYSPKSRDDVTWQEVSRIRSTLTNRKSTYILYYKGTGEEEKLDNMVAGLRETTYSVGIRKVSVSLFNDLDDFAETA